MGAAEDLIDAVRMVDDLDVLHSFLVNEFTDAYLAPQFSNWLVDLLNLERKRRAAGVDEAEYEIPRFSAWPASMLVQSNTVVLTILEAATIDGNPERMNFAFKLAALLIVSLGLAYLELVAVVCGQN